MAESARSRRASMWRATHRTEGPCVCRCGRPSSSYCGVTLHAGSRGPICASAVRRCRDSRFVCRHPGEGGCSYLCGARRSSSSTTTAWNSAGRPGSSLPSLRGSAAESVCTARSEMICSGVICASDSQALGSPRITCLHPSGSRHPSGWASSGRMTVPCSPTKDVSRKSRSKRSKHRDCWRVRRIFTSRVTSCSRPCCRTGPRCCHGSGSEA